MESNIRSENNSQRSADKFQLRRHVKLIYRFTHRFKKKETSLSLQARKLKLPKVRPVKNAYALCFAS